ncbi:hypothetical protein BJX61DRAFT_547863 [Aspergillus egyptiacus]|nr:hypothetical protein BJX61DRAFT_547863 [Aspergillus egyptiacus]
MSSARPQDPGMIDPNDPAFQEFQNSQCFGDSILGVIPDQGQQYPAPEAEINFGISNFPSIGWTTPWSFADHDHIPNNPADQYPLNQPAYGQNDVLWQPQPAIQVSPLHLNDYFTARDQSELINIIRRVEMYENILPIATRSQLTDLRDLFQRGICIIENSLPSVSEPKEDTRVKDKKREMHRCFLCNEARMYNKRGTIKRHIMYTHHFAEVEFQCPRCTEPGPRDNWRFRRDKFLVHMQKHRLLGADIDAHSRKLSPPGTCPYNICQKPIRSWPEFWTHIYKHCLVGSSSGSRPETRNGGGGGGSNGGGRDQGSGPGSYHCCHPGSNGFMSAQNNFPTGDSGGNGFGASGARNGEGSGRYAQNAENCLDAQGHEDSHSPSLGSGAHVSAPQPKLTSSQQHHDPRKGSNSSRAAADSATSGSASTLPTKSFLQKAAFQHDGLAKHPDEDLLSKSDAEAEAKCIACGHTIEGCRRCAKLVGNLTNCHRCADTTCQKTSLIHEGDIRQRTLSSMPFPSELLGLNKTGDSIESSKLGGGLSIPSAKLAEGRARVFQVRMSQLAFRIKHGFQESQGEMSKATTEGRLASKKAALPTREEVAIAELQRLKYFEQYLYTAQVRGSFLECIQETLIVSEAQRFTASASLQEISYQKVSLRAGMGTEVPGYCLCYLAREKGYSSSEADLQVARQAAPKRRPHLRVRIRAIAGVLALRAAVSKTPPTVDNVDSGDGWELGIPLPPGATHEDLVKFLTLLVQLLVIFLRVPVNPEIYVVLASGCLDVPRLT